MNNKIVEKNSMIFYRSFFDAIKNLPDENRLEIFDAILNYGFDFVEPQLSGISEAIFILIKPKLQANLKRYENSLIPKFKQTISKREANENHKFDFVGFDDDEKKSINDWLIYRNQIKKNYVEIGLKKLRTQLLSFKERGFSLSLIITTSITNGWRGLFEPKKNLVVKSTTRDALLKCNNVERGKADEF